MVGVGVGLQQPVGPQAMLAHVLDHAVGAGGAGAAGLGVVVQHRIDDGGAARRIFMDHIGDGGGDRIEEGLDDGGHGGRSMGRAGGPEWERSAGATLQLYFQ